MTQTAMGVDTNSLPAGWKWVTLEAVSKELFAGGDAPRDNLSVDKTEEFHVPVISNGLGTKSLYGYTNTPRVVEPAITISARGTIGHPEIRNEPFYPIIRVIVLIPYKNVADISYLKYAIQTLNVTSVGSAIPQLTVPMIRKRNIPLPPLEEQKRIAAILNEQMAAVDKAKKAAEERLAAAKALPDAYLREVFEGEEAKEWPVGKLSELSSRITKGESPGWQGYGYQSDGVRYIKSENVGSGKFLDEPRTFISDAFDEKLIRSSLKPGDVLMNITGASIGRACVVSNNLGRANVSQNVAVVTTDDNLSPSYLLAFIMSPEHQLRIKATEKATARPSISLTDIGNYRIPLPRPDEQNQIVSELEDKLPAVKLAEESIQQELETIEAMPAALLRKAFAGEL